jgi:signal transduction histidine kinase
MPLPILPLLAIAALNALIGYYVLRQNPHRLPNKSFAFFAFSVAAWTLWVAAAHNLHDHSTFYVRAAFSAASVMIFALLVLFRSFPYEPILRWDWSLRLFCVAAIILSSLSFTPLIVSRAALEPTGLQAQYARLYPVYGTYIYSCFAISVLHLFRKYRSSTGVARLQLNYLFLGLLLPGLGVTITNLLLPLTVGHSRTGHYGPYFAVAFLGFTAHALIHYRLMDIRLVLRRGVTILLAFAGSVLALVVVSILLWALVPFDLHRSHVILLILGSILIGFLLPLLRHFLGTIFDRYVYRQDIHYSKMLHNASQALVAILDIDDLAAFTTKTTVQTLKSETVALYLSRSQSFHLLSEKHGSTTVQTPSCPLIVPSTSPLIAFLAVMNDALVTDEIPQRFPEHSRSQLVSTLAANRWALVVPIHAERSLQGFVAVGPKLSGDPFFANELEFVEILSNQLGIALRNAELYQQIALANDYIENILGAIDSGVVAIDRQPSITLCNTAAEKLTGVTTSLLRQNGPQHLPTPLWDILASTLADGHARSQVELSLPATLGTVPIVCSTSPLRDRFGATLGAVVVFSDLTRLKDLEREQRRSERLAAFGTLASGIAHEIKNPLVAIRTFAELLPDRFSEGEFREDFSKVVVAEIDRIDDLVDRLRSIAPPSRPAVGLTDLRKPVTDTLLLLRGQLEQSRTSVHSDFRDPAPFVAVADTQLKQLFLNLFLNAVEAMGTGGQLTIRITRTQATDISRVLVEVSDTGPGIPDSIRASIFDPFFTTKQRGSGLGLAICRSIAEAHQGSIHAQNNFPNAGATLAVEFPTAAAVLPTVHADAL